MTFDKWFNSQSTLVKVILIILPLVGWIVELLVRLSVMLKTQKVEHIVVFVLFVVFGWGLILNIIDIIYMCMTGHLILAE